MFRQRSCFVLLTPLREGAKFLASLVTWEQLSDAPRVSGREDFAYVCDGIATRAVWLCFDAESAEYGFPGRCQAWIAVYGIEITNILVEQPVEARVERLASRSSLR